MENFLRKMCAGKLVRALSKCVAPLVAGAIWALSSQSRLPTIKGVLGVDKVQHLLAYAVLAVGVAFWFSRARWRAHPALTLLAVVCISSLYGATDEVHQHFVPGRTCNAWDWVADTLGAAIGAALYVASLKHGNADGRLKGWRIKIEDDGQ